MADAHGAQRAVFVSLFEPNLDIPSYSCEVLLPTPPQNGEGDLCYILKYIIANQSSLSNLIRESSFKFEKESTYFKSKIVEIPENTTLDHGTVITAKVVGKKLAAVNLTNEEQDSAPSSDGKLSML